MAETITSRFIIECWKKNEYPDGFDDMLEQYVDLKRKTFMNIKIKDLWKWMSPLVLAIEIGLKRDYDRFARHKEFWELLLSKKYSADLKTEEVVWGVC